MANFIVGGFWKIDHCMDVLTTEPWAPGFGLSLAQRCNRLVINSNNLEVIETMNNGGRSAGGAAAVFMIANFLACDFAISRFEHCNRQANKVANEHAILTRFSSNVDWFKDPMN